MRGLEYLWDLVRTLVLRELKVRYRRSSIGFLWTMLQPLLFMLVLHLVFSTIFRFDVENYPVYVLSGILFWNFFSQSVVQSMNSLRANTALITKLPVRKEVFPIAAVLAGSINFLLALIPLFLILFLTGHQLTPAAMFLPISVVIVVVFTLGVGLLLAPLAVFFADVVEFVSVSLLLMMFLTPIIYPLAIVPDHMRWLIHFNPLRAVLEVFRDPIYLGKVPGFGIVAVAAVLGVAVLGLGLIVFRRTSARIPLYV